MGRLILLLVVVFCGSSGSKSASWRVAKKLMAELIFRGFDFPILTSLLAHACTTSIDSTGFLPK